MTGNAAPSGDRFAARLKLARASRQLNQAELAARAGLQPAAISALRERAAAPVVREPAAAERCAGGHDRLPAGPGGRGDSGRTAGGSAAPQLLGAVG